MRVDTNSSAAFQVPGSKVDPSSTLLGQTENEHVQSKENLSVSDLADKVNKSLAEVGTHIKVKLHEKTNTIMVTVVNNGTDEVVLEIPREKALDMMYNMCVQAGVFFDEKL